MNYAELSNSVLDAFKQSNWDVSEGVTQLSDNLYVAEFTPNIRSYLRDALKDNDIDMFSGFEFDGTDEGLLNALNDKQEELTALTDDPDADIDNSVIGFSENLQYLIDAVDEAINSEEIDKAESIDSEAIEDDEDLIIDNESEGIDIRGYEGTWKSVDSIERDGKQYFLMENEQKGDDLYNLVLDSEGYLIVEGVDGAFDENVLNAIDAYNGFSIDLLEDVSDPEHEEDEPLMDAGADDVVIGSYEGVWHVVDNFEYNGADYFLMQLNDSEEGEFYNVLLDVDGKLIAENIDGEINDDVLDAIDAYDGQPVDMLDRISVSDSMLEYAQGDSLEFEQAPDGQFSMFGVMDSQQYAADDMPSGSNISDSFEALRNDIAGMSAHEEHISERQAVTPKSHGGPEL